MTREQVDIRPTTAIYSYFSKLSYTPWLAIAEFVDNSTQSYFDHEEELQDSKDWTKLKIEIKYTERNGGSLIITDNAYGMDDVDFKRALRLNSKPENTSGRNEFGMGLKTAACWFGKYWTLTSSRLGENTEYHTVFDVADFEIRQQSDIDIDINQVPREKHGTIIEITKLNKQIRGRSVSKIKDYLSSIYRRDIQTGKIAIIYNDEELSYEEPEVYIDESGTLYKRELDFTVEHSGKEYPVKGYVAVRETGNVGNSGFALIRRGRVIVPNYRPTELFGKPNTFAYQRIVGELDMDDWPVTQAKDKFDWENDGLEDEFIEELKPLIHDYRDVAEHRRKRKKPETTGTEGTSVEKIQAGSESPAVTSVPHPNPMPPSVDDTASNNPSGSASGQNVPGNADDGTKQMGVSDGGALDSASEGTSEKTPSELHISSPAPSTCTEVTPREWKMTCDFDGESYPLKVELVEIEGNPLIKLVKSKDEDGEVTRVKINLLHPFFNERRDPKTADAIIAMAASMAVAEKESGYDSTDGMVPASYIREKISEVLKEAVFTHVLPEDKD